MAEQIVWTSADGAVIDLTSDSYRHLDGQSGRFFPGVEIIAAARPQQAGSVITKARHVARTVMLPIVVRGTSWADVRVKTRALISAFDPVRGDGTLSVVTHVGDIRVLRCRPADGLEGVETWETRSDVRQQFVFRLVAVDPFWSPPSSTVSTIFAPSPGDPLLDDLDDPLLDDLDDPFLDDNPPGGSWFPFLPITFLSSELVGVVTIVNPGDVDAWPAITINGPITDPVLINTSTGQTLALTVDLLAGQSVEFDASPGVRTVTGPAGNLYASLTERQWWPLKRGANSIRVEAAGSLPTTSVSIVWKPGYLSV